MVRERRLVRRLTGLRGDPIIPAPDMRDNRVLTALLLALAAFAASGAAPQGQSVPAAPAAMPPPLPQGPAPDLDLVFTGQVVGYVEPCG